MNYFKIIFTVLVLLGVGYLGLKLFWESDFEKLNTKSIDLPEWSYQNSDQDELSEAIQSSGIASKMKSIYSSLSENYYYPSFTDKYWVVLTRYNTLDDGLWFFATPTYTRVLIIDRSTEEIVSKKLVFKNITNAKIVGGDLYFRYDEPVLWALLTVALPNFYRLDKLDDIENKLGKTSLNLN